MDNYLSVFLVGLFLNVFPACKDNALTPSGPIKKLELTAAEREKTISDNAFSLSLFEESLESLGNDENAMVSPLSVSMAIGMVANGAKGDTKEAIHQALKFDGHSSSFLNEYHKKILATLPQLDPKVKLEIANSIWYREGFKVLPSFVKTNENFYQATARALNFNDPAATKVINDWVNQKTQGKIPTIVNEIPEDMVMYLINAIYFKGDWTEPFKKERTANADFHAPNGTIQTPFMRKEERFNVAETSSFKAIELPYADDAFSMLAFLPNKDNSPKELLKELRSKGKWEETLAGFSSRQTQLSFPKFKFSYENKLNDELTKMGMGIAFTNQADFTGINEEGRLTISEVKHKSFIEVNEEGTEAAAVTSIGIETTSMPLYFVMNLDRPFLFFIREKSSGLILFAGQINNPAVD